MAGERGVNTGQTAERGSFGPVQRLNYVERDLSQVLQEREKLRKDRGVYLQRIQYLAKEQMCFQQELRELTSPYRVTFDQEETQRQVEQFLEHINIHMLSLRQADDAARYHLLRLQQEAVLLGLPPPAHPWSSDADILLPDEEDESQQQPSPLEPPHHDTPRPLTATVSDDSRKALADSLIQATGGGRREPMEICLREELCEMLLLRAHHSGLTQEATPQCLSQAKDHHPGSLKTTVEGTETMSRFSVDNMLRKATMLVGDKVQYETSTNPNTQARAVTMEILADTLRATDTEEHRRTWRPIGGAEPSLEEPDGPVVVRTEHTKGTVLRVPPKQNTLVSNLPIKDLPLGSLKAVVEGVEKKLSFSADDVLTKATMLVGDKVQFEISTNLKTKAERAVNVEILADTFECDHTEAQRKIGVVLGLSNSFGYIKCSQDPKLVFDFCEVLEDKKLSHSENVEFTIVPNTVAGTGYQAIRIRRQKMFTPVPTLDSPTTTHSEKVFISVPPLEGPTTTHSEKVFTSVPPLEGPTTTQTQKKITIQPTNTKERMQKDTGINTDGPKTGKHVQVLPSSVSAVKLAMKENTEDPNTKTTEASGRRSSIHPNCDHGNQSRNRIPDKGGRIDRPQSYRSSSRERRQVGVSKDESDRERSRSRSRERSTGNKRSRSSDRVRDQGRDRSHRSSSRERRRERSKERWNRNNSRSRSRDHSHRSHSRSHSSSRSRSRSRERGGKIGQFERHHTATREWIRKETSRERGSRYRRSRSRSKELFPRNRRSRSRERSRELSHRNRHGSSRRRSKELSPRNRRSSSRKRSRELSPRNRRSSSRERSRDGNRDRGRDQDRSSNQGRNRSPECRDEKRKRQSNSGEGSSRKRRRSRSPRIDHVTAKVEKDLSSSKASGTTTYGSSNPDAVEDEESEDLARKKMELEELEALIAEKLAENAALELEMTSLPCQTSLSPQHQRTMPPLRQAHKDNPFQMDEEYKKQLKEVRLGSANEVQRDNLRHYDRAARFRRDSLCGDGVEPVLCVEVQFLRQAEENGEDRCVHEREANDCFEHHMERDKSIVPHDQKREDQTPSLSQHEQKMHRRSDEGRRFPEGATLGKSIDPVGTKHVQPRHGHGTNRNDKTVWICGHGLVAVARRMSMWPECGVQLGKMKGLWSGTQGMTWKELVAHLNRLRNKWPLPHMLIIHLGDDNLNMRNTEDLLITIREELTHVRNLFPQCLIVWSDILPTCFWKQCMTPDVEVDEAAGRIHDMINCRAHAIVTELGGRVITHDNIGPEHYYPNDICLSDQGIQKFNQNLQQFVENWEKELITTSEHLEITSNSPEPTNNILEPVDSFHDSLSHSVDDLDVTREDSGNTIISLQQPQKDENAPKNTSLPRSAPATSTAPDVSSSSSPAVSSSGTLRPENSGGLPPDADLDMTPKDSGNTIISLQQSQKDVNCTKNTAQPHSSPSTSTQKRMKPETYKTVWMCGYALSGLARRMATAQKHASKLGNNSPSIRVHHLGGPGMTWTNLMLQMHEVKSNQPYPDMVIIHLGSNNINMTKKEDLLNTIKKDLTLTHNIFPQCQIVWSDMLLMRFYKQGMTPSNKADEAGDRIHEVINRTAHAIVNDLGGRVITHDNIGPELYSPRGNEMVISNQGIKRFNLNIQQFVDEWKRQVNFVSAHTETIPKSPEPTNNNLEPVDPFHDSLSHSVDNLDVTREDSGNTIISPQQPQKDENSPKNLSQPHTLPPTSFVPDISSSSSPAAGDDMDVTPLDTATISPQQELNQKRKPFGSEKTVEKEIVEDVCSDFFKGTVLRLPAKDKQAVNNMLFNRNKELLLGTLQAFVEGVEKKLSFSADDVLTKATMLVGDKVQFKISTNLKTKAERAVNVEILADTFECDHTEEQRKIGVVVGLSNIFEFGYIKYPQDPELYFKFCEVMEEKELSLLEKVEFTVVPKSTSEAGDQAIRVRRLTDRVFIPAPKLEGLGTADKEKQQQVRESNESSVEVNQTHGSSEPITGPVTKTCGVKGPPKVVWMCGFALSNLAKRITSAQNQAAKLGNTCASMRVYQWGTPQMTWAQLVIEMCRFKEKQPRPDMLLIHLGGRNVDLRNPHCSLKSIRKDLGKTHRIFPQCLIVWSDMLPGGSWKFKSMTVKAKTKAINVINHRARSLITDLGGRVITHQDIGPERYLSNGLSKQVVVMFKENIHRFLDKWEMGVNPESELTDTIAPPADSTGPTSDRSHLSQNASEPHSLPATSTAPAVSSSSPPAATSTAPAVSSSSPPAATSTAPAVSSSSPPAATSTAPAVSSSSPPAATSTAPAVSSSSPPAATSTAPAVSSSAPPAATSTAPAVSSSAPPAATSTAPAVSSSAPSAATSTAPAVSSTAPPAAGDDVDMTPEDSGNTTISHQLSQKQQQVRESNESSVEVNLTHGSSEPITGPVTKKCDVKGPPKVVWMCGFALSGLAKRITSAQNQAAKLGNTCASMRVHQWGTPQMTWMELVIEMCRFKRQQPRPDMLLIHLGGKNVDLRNPHFSLKSIRKDLGKTHRIFPQCLIVWSDMLPGGSWKFKSMTDEATEKAIDVINHRARSLITDLGGRVITHQNIGPELCLSNDHEKGLSKQFIEMFKENIHKFLDEWEMGVNPDSDLTDTTSSTIAPAADSTGPTSDRSHLSQNASEPHSLLATSTAPAVSSSSPPAATSTAPAVSPSSPPAATSTAPAVSSSSPPAATSTAPAVSSSAPLAEVDDVDMTSEDSGNTTVSHQLSQKTPHVPQSKDISSITVKQSLSAEKSSNTLKPQKEDVCKQEVRPISAAVTDIKAISTESKTREEFLKCYRLFTLNPNTAHKKLYLMENNRKVEWSDQDQPYPHNPRRFVEKCFQVLCWESISERRYFEVEWSGSVCISLSFDNQGWKKRVDVKFGSNILSWALKLSRTSCCVYHNDEKIKVPQVTSSRIGVCVDYRAGTLAFYSVTDTVTLIWKVQNKFSFPLFPGFGLGRGSSVKLL
ncbi:uncharacterized protein LOC121685730 isoform X4 [Alosa sapidissima]|uniref:uncharacterized protein LOC121685730 isoform X4 n=1 Tax=Alosa sapidissima TaxID=34773 RepID=UPI001C08B652|nr:uncharacterized protein LOC121685730 isoform X4 [Alosa sapidissima]